MNIRLTKILSLFLICAIINSVTAAQNKTDSTVLQKPMDRDGQHDFDFEIGTWKTHLKRLTNPLSGDQAKWAEYNGITTARKVWNGKANLVELVADGVAGHFEGLSLRLYDPEAKQWSLHFANAKNGLINPPTLGRFINGIGEFYNQEDFKGRIIFVKFIIVPLNKDSIRFEQSFSQDGGKNWEVNWIATDTRIIGKSD